MAIGIITGMYVISPLKTQKTDDASGNPQTLFKKAVRTKIESNLKKFVQTKKYVFMFSGSEIKVHAKGSNFKTMDGKLESKSENQDLEIFTIFGENSDSLIDGKGIKIIVKDYKVDEKDKSKEIVQIVVRNLKLKPGTLKCYSMTSLLTFQTRSKSDTISLETLGHNNGKEYLPPKKYKYFIEFQYYYGIEGLIFWGWLVLGMSTLSLTLMIRMFRMVSARSLLYHPKMLLENLKSKIVKEDKIFADEDEGEANWFVDLGNKGKKKK